MKNLIRSGSSLIVFILLSFPSKAQENENKNDQQKPSLQARDIVSQKKQVLTDYLFELKQLEELRNTLKKNLSKQAKEDAFQEKYPLTPNDIIKSRKKDQEIEKAKNKPLLGSIKNNIRTITIDTDAVKPITLNVSKGYASSIVFFDYNGDAWAIEGDIIGNSKAYTSKKGIGKNNSIAIFEINQQFKETNALIKLKGLNAPLVIKLKNNMKEVDSRLTVRIPMFNPDSNIEIKDRLESVGLEEDPYILDVLYGNKINNAKRLKLKGVKGDAFLINDYIYIRTKYDLVLPPIKDKRISSLGYKAFKVTPTNTLMFYANGKRIYATIEDSLNYDIIYNNSIFKD